MLRRMFIVAIAAMTLTGCASTPNALDLTTRDSFFVKEASVDWKVDESKRTPNEAYDAGKADLQKRLKDAVEAEFKTSPSGPDAVTFSIEVKSYSRVGAAMGNIIGGSNMVVADVHVIRQSDQKELGVYTGVSGVFASNGGLIGAMVQAASKPDIVGIMANSFAQNLHARFNSK